MDYYNFEFLQILSYRTYKHTLPALTSGKKRERHKDRTYTFVGKIHQSPLNRIKKQKTANHTHINTCAFMHYNKPTMT